MDRDDSDGYVFVRPLFTALTKFEGSEPSMRLYFPELVRSIDLTSEAKRIQALQFTPSEAASKPSDATSQEAVTRRSAHALPPSTLPNDSEAIAWLTEGERRIAEKNPRAAETEFQRVLAKYPEQPRAWYGLGLVALLDHDGARAKQVFGRLTSGEHAATSDPLVLTWSHIYLARILDDEGQLEQAKNEYQAALSVTGGPEQARQAAQKGLAAAQGQKQPERP
jgi:tetratricopeptide (TPR) repeat protein